jgi:SAM-dependent methyltransferase
VSIDVEPAVAPPVAGYHAVFTAALRGEACRVVGIATQAQQLPMDSWSKVADTADRVVLGHCLGATLDIGCGPGRMSQHLAMQGGCVLGIDLVPEAVALTRERGSSALVRDVYEHLPGEGRWDTALLADGNIGIGGDPVRLLGRVHDLLAPNGRAVVDLAPPGAGIQTVMLTLECAGNRSAPFAWSFVGPESVRQVALTAGMYVTGVHEYEGRWFAVLQKRL